MKEYSVSYMGYLVIEAEDENVAFDMAHQMIGNSGIVNDGDMGEWQIAEVELITDEENGINS
tara:strand:- start:184 stop:369 length:186 start_codon:yes stop_codon:yes gene_type:complete